MSDGDSDYNEKEVFAGFLQRPVFFSSSPMYLNFGGIGAIIGHEIGHGFDDQGKEFDATGNFASWWSKSSLTNYNEKAKCIVDQYNNFRVDQIDMNINGELTQGENIADTGGVMIAFEACKDYLKKNDIKKENTLPGLKYTPEQLFFMQYGAMWCTSFSNDAMKFQMITDPHSPGMARVWGPLQNSDEFAKAFKCAKGTGMNPLKTCKVW